MLYLCIVRVICSQSYDDDGPESDVSTIDKSASAGRSIEDCCQVFVVTWLLSEASTLLPSDTLTEYPTPLERATATSANAKLVVRFVYLFPGILILMYDRPETNGGWNITWSLCVVPPTVGREL